MIPDHTFVSGMYVRLPTPEDMVREDGEFRDFRIGQIVEIDDIALIATVLLQTLAPDQAPQMETIECSLAILERCYILPDTQYTHRISGDQGTILAACQNTITPGTYYSYYVQTGGLIERVCESNIIVPSIRQDPSPYDQLRRYEFHSPIWRSYRDQLIEDYSELHNASFGIEDLVGSRVMLLPHQAEVITKVLGSTICRFMLADEVGLGKTIEACVILKSLRRREQDLKTLIIAPASLLQQWYNELNDKFWLQFTIARPGTRVHLHADSPGVIMSAEDLASHDIYWEWIRKRTWGLLIADEAHHLRKNPVLYERIHYLSRAIQRVLILTATPIQQHADEYLSLLTLLDPEHYAHIDTTSFHNILAAQRTIRQTIVYLTPNLTEEYFDAEEFLEEIDSLTKELEQDNALKQLVDEVRKNEDNQQQALDSARDVVAYVSENYRIEGRIIRNRRASLDISLPVRELDTTCHYNPEEYEWLCLDDLYGYIDFCLEHSTDELPVLEYCRNLLHTAASSPHALLWLLELREHALLHHRQIPSHTLSRNLAELALPSNPRQETNRVANLVKAIPAQDGEYEVVRHLAWRARQWRDWTQNQLVHISVRDLSSKHTLNDRLAHVLLALHNAIDANPSIKIVIFTHWYKTIEALLPVLERFYPRGAVAQFHAEMDPEALHKAADTFQSNDDCRLLVCDELGGEGRNFQIADMIIHVDIPWTPAQIEQRIGRVDRLGRSGKVLSVVPYAKDTLEHHLFCIWEEAFHLFTRSMSGMEIALEGIQNELAQALTQSTRHGLERILPAMIERAKHLHQEVEEERYFEEGAINKRLRQQFQAVSERYRDGSRLRNVFLQWANLAGLKCMYNKYKDTVEFYPKQFNLKSMNNAKFLPPNMEEALRRSRNTNNLVITGTFNRDKAVQREDLIFFAPSDDPWTDAIIANAMEADRGRCCAILRQVPDSDIDWKGFELLYRIRINPRPLFALGYPPSHLFRAQGFLVATTHRILVSLNGNILKKSDPVWHSIQPPFKKGSTDQHIGKRDSPLALLQAIKEGFPPNEWRELVEHLKQVAESYISEEYDFTGELAEEAQQEFAQQIAGWKASRQWFMRETGNHVDMGNILEYERISAALVEGI